METETIDNESKIDIDYELELQRQSWIRRDNENTALFDPENPTEAQICEETGNVGIECVYEFLYNSCTCESAAATVSIHKTLKGAYNAMRKHKWDACVEHREEYLTWGKGYFTFKLNFDAWKWWGIRKVEVLA